MFDHAASTDTAIRARRAGRRAAPRLAVHALHLLAATLILLALAGCNGKSQTTGGGGASGDADAQVPWTEGGDQPDQPRTTFRTNDINEIAGVGDGEAGPVLGDMLYSLYDVGQSRGGLSRTVIHVFPESSRRYRPLLRNPRDYVPKRIPDAVMQDLLDSAEEGGFTRLLRPMSQEEVERLYLAGETLITFDDRGRLRGAVRPRRSEGASEEDVETFHGMKLLMVHIANTYFTPIVTGGEGAARGFSTPSSGRRQ
jgi:hypothetical protein